MEIKSNFVGGNIFIEKQEENTYYLNNELRDTTEDWFYWAFCADGFAGKTITFRFRDNRIGYYGPAVSHDLKKWERQYINPPIPSGTSEESTSPIPSQTVFSAKLSLSS